MASIVEQPATVAEPPRRSQLGQPTWEIAEDFPLQGEWTERSYLNLDAGRLVEFCDGVLEFLPMPSILHQRIALWLFRVLDEFVRSRQLGEAFTAPLPVRLWAHKYREPDVVFLGAERVPDDPRQQPDGADLVIEVVSPGAENRARDLEIKPQEYARAGIREYWTVDPESQVVTVRALEGQAYRVHGEFKPGETATSALLDEFCVAVNDLFAAGAGGAAD